MLKLVGTKAPSCVNFTSTFTLYIFSETFFLTRTIWYRSKKRSDAPFKHELNQYRKVIIAGHNETPS